jgi:hypothetical protein
MAKATRKPVVPQPTEYVLELTEDEAKFLVGVLNRIGGSPENSPRGISDDILSALSPLVDYYSLPDTALKPGKQSIYFRDGGTL